MPISPAEKLGPYEIIGPIGKGGMGEVWKANDPRLNRDVAIKVSAAQFSERFEREAKAIAALNHPNICQIYDVGPNYLVIVGRGCPAEGPAAAGEDPRLRGADSRCARCHALQEHHSPRFEAGQHHGHQTGHQAAGLRAGQTECAAGRRRLHRYTGSDTPGTDCRNAAVHGAGANARQGGRSALRSVQLRLHPVRDADGEVGLRRAERGQRDCGDPGAAGAVSCRRRSGGTGSDSATLPGEGSGGGYEPRWRADGQEIYFLSEDRKLMAVTVGAGPQFGVPAPLFQTRVPAGVTANRTNYVPSRDGKRFLVNTQNGDPAPTPITVVLNWTAGLKR